MKKDDEENFYEITNNMNIREYIANIVADLPDSWINTSSFLD